MLSMSVPNHVSVKAARSILFEIIWSETESALFLTDLQFKVYSFKGLITWVRRIMGTTFECVECSGVKERWRCIAGHCVILTGIALLWVCNASSDLLFTIHLMRLGIGRSLHGSSEHEGLLNISSKIYTRLSLLTPNWCPSYLSHPLQTVWMCLMTLRPAFVPLLKRKVFVRPGTFLTRHISKLRTKNMRNDLDTLTNTRIR